MGTSLSEQFPPHVLREYALIADGERGALLGPRGDIAWMCVPRWHDDAVFSTLLGGGGVYSVSPEDPRTVWGGQYEPGSLIWRGRWITTDSIIECRNALAMPADPRCAILLRRVYAALGEARVRIHLDVHACFGRNDMTDVKYDSGVWTATSGPLHLRITGLDDAVLTDDGFLEAVVAIEEGDHRDLTLEIGDYAPVEAPVDPQFMWDATEHAWADAVPDLTDTLTPADARQAYAVLHGMTSATGGMVAAATTSLPERAKGSGNYDYRYVWIRDQCIVGQAIAACGAYPLLGDAVRFVSARLLSDGDRLAPAYTVTGGPVPDERHIGLPGYPGGSDKVGNGASDQFQLGVFGEALLLFAAAAGRDMLDADGWRAVDVCIEAVNRHWTEPDSGIWELGSARWAHSRLNCAAGLRAIAAYADAGKGAGLHARADEIVANVGADCLHPEGRWQRSPDDPRVDASLLLPILRGALNADDPRSVATVEAIRRDLGRDGYIYRFSQDARDLADAEGAFLMCGFDMAMVLNQIGKGDEALRHFDRNRDACGSPGLFTEEYDIGQRQLRGNLPQAFVHGALLEAAKRLA
ncbi:glycoside hydrolase family 15 protein [Spelaeicoccus albus]|uniref:GH15 family glucan-1,4-alpha-glucosidase n=1 Tax=Spelaeicoccus albus TaxID=1280376 RepID=A0A7Z0IIR6_9MICO|nr:glycoside hydrolase family 15 protein [Spelaeicoccus albus]NYI68734.1 GH15 family glucan-1,4-alpha-glucosidase [Spelaeicoccus albus]